MTQTNNSEVSTITNDEGNEVLSFEGKTFNSHEELTQHLVGKNKAITNQNKELRDKFSSSAEMRNTNPDIEAKISKLEFKTEGYSDAEIDFIQKNGGREALNNPLVKTTINVMREQSKAEAAAVSGSGGSSTFGKYTQAEIKNMTSEEYKLKMSNQ
jgi:hypothetical protein